MNRKLVIRVYTAIVLLAVYSCWGAAEAQVFRCPPYSKEEITKAVTDIVRQAKENEVRNITELALSFDMALRRASGGGRSNSLQIIFSDPVSPQSTARTFNENKFYSCYPELRGLIQESQRTKIEREKDRREQQAALQKQQQLPDNRLRLLYENYIFVRLCFDTRRGHLLVYINESQMNEARIAVKAKEQTLLKEHPNLQSERIWRELSAETSSASEVMTLGSARFVESIHLRCSLALTYLLSHSDGYQPSAIKKDF